MAPLRSMIIWGIIVFDIILLVGSDHTGRSFHVLFMDTGYNDGDPSLYFTASQPARVTISAGSGRKERIDVSRNSPQRYTPSSNLRRSGTFTDGNNCAYITATSDISVIGVNSDAYSTDGFLALPDQGLGTEYVVATRSRHPGSNEGVSQVGVVSTVQGTRITFAIPPANETKENIEITLDSITYSNGDTFTITLNKERTIQLQNNTDFTGLRIYADNPIAVFSGNDHAFVRNVVAGGNADHLAAQLPPVNQWGREFVVTSLPSRLDQDLIRMVSFYPNTNIDYGGVRYDITEAGGYMELTLTTPSVYVSADKPIMVIQYGSSQVDPLSGDATMILIPPIEQYVSEYVITTPASSRDLMFTNFALIAIHDDHKSEITVDGQAVPDNLWLSVTGSAHMVAVVYQFLESVAHTDPARGVPFGLVLYGQAQSESYGYPAGIGTSTAWSMPCVRSPPVYDDDVDNDCDGLVDEETCNNLDNDGDGLRNEDCGIQSPVFTSATGNTGSTADGPVATTAVPYQFQDCSHSCQFLRVNGSIYHPAYMGLYHREAYTFSERPVYRLKSCDAHLYFMTTVDTKFWFVGPELGGLRGVMVGREDTRLPGDVTRPWRAYNSTTSHWVDDDVTFECVCSDISYCEAIKFTSTDYNMSSIDGLFYPYATSEYGRIFYQHEDRKWYLYHVTNDSGCGQWVVGTVAGSRVGIMYTGSYTLDHLGLEGKWTALIGGNWVTGVKVNIACVTP